MSTSAASNGETIPQTEPQSDLPPYEAPPLDERASAASDELPAFDRRPLAGEVRPGEPSREEIADALLNTPSEIFKIRLPIEGSFNEETLDYDKYEDVPIVNLTSGNSIKYIAVFAPQFESIVKNLLPVATVGVQSFGLLKHFSNESRGLLKEICKTRSLGEVCALLDKLGMHDYEIETVEAMAAAARKGLDIEFMIHMATIFLAPVGAPALKAVRECAFSDPIVALSEKLPKLALASILSSFKRRNIAVDEAAIAERVELLDSLEQMDIVYKQFEHMYQRGTVGRFFKQAMRMATMSTATGMRLG